MCAQHQHLTAGVPATVAIATLLVAMQVARKGGARSTLLYNLLGAAQWDVLLMEASIGRQAGLTQRVSLIEVPPLSPEREHMPHPTIRKLQ